MVLSPLLILYGTTEGHTGKIARYLAAELRRHGAAVDVFEASPVAPDPREYAGVIVAASVHMGRYQRPVERWVRSYASTLRHLPSAFLSICLAVLQNDPEVQAELSAMVGRFITRTGWFPPQVKQVAGAVCYTRYGWLKRALMRRMVRKAGGDTDVSRDYEYTDWDDLAGFAGRFAEPGGAAQSVPEANREPARTSRIGSP